MKSMKCDMKISIKHWMQSILQKKSIVSLKISMKRLRNVGSVLDKDFSFIYHRNIICQCSRVSAAFISPYVFKSILNDSTIDSFIIDSFEFNQEEIEQIPTIMNSLIQKGKIEISNDSKYQQTIELIHKIAESLGNDEILNQIYIKSSYYEGISLSEAIQKLHNYFLNLLLLKICIHQILKNILIFYIQIISISKCGNKFVIFVFKPTNHQNIKAL
ncbi:hypothetical protein TRFO_28333 [Tritrichomonas foetus]|uniref:Uncharacterized protein n=1 Tax=Tritrichomonas foetus TaxID=1144522 RepID=A0A1J4K0F7_9EUKA|nr:hypothetical protein TRFO_28333 [Tritrichomonas foetus]|eukprot:OHT04224.1 hypothetical protein TRFO_28333 [Tritrichomonas foetus]